MFSTMMDKLKKIDGARSERWEKRHMLQSEKIQIQATSAPGANAHIFPSR